MSRDDLKRKTAVSIVWSFARIASTNLSSFIVFSLLARLLSPHDFGIFALASLFVEVTRVIAMAGLSDAVVQARDLDELLAETAFWSNLALGLVVGVGAWCLAPVYAAAIGQPEVEPVLKWLALLVPIASLAGIHSARKLRLFGHKSVAARAVAAGMLGGAAAIFAAYRGLGVWSLVVQAAVSDIVLTLGAWQAFHWLPRLNFSIARLKSIASFSGSMALNQLLWLTLVRVQDVVISRSIGATAVGAYRVGWRMIDLISQSTIQPIVMVSTVTLSKLQTDPAGFANAYLRLLAIGALIAFPALVGFGVLADDIIPTLFGDKWVESAALAKIFTLMVVPFTLNFFVGPGLAALGKSADITKVAALQLILTIALSVAAAPYGLRAIAAAYVLRAYLTMPYQMIRFRRHSGIALRKMLWTIAPPLCAAVVMAVLLIGISPFLHQVLMQRMAFLAAAVPLGAAFYLATLMVFARPFVTSNILAIKPLLRRNSTSESLP